MAISVGRVPHSGGRFDWCSNRVAGRVIMRSGRLRGAVTVSLSVVEASDPNGLVDSAARIGEKISRLDTLMTQQRRALAELRANWQGKAASAAITRAEADLDQQEALRARLQALQTALQSGGSQLSSTRRGLLMVVNSLRATGWQVADDGTCTPPPYLPPVFTGLAMAWTAVVQKLLAQYSEIDTSTAAAITSALGGPVPQTPAGTLGDPRRLPDKETAPEDVKKWWDSLSQAEKDGLIAKHPRSWAISTGFPPTCATRSTRR